MNADLWRKLDPLADQTSEAIGRFLTSPEATDMKSALKQAAALLPDGYSVSLDIRMEVFDPERGEVLPLLTMGLATSGKSDPYLTHGDSSPTRYVVDGDICEVPHDRCPHCWALWDFKLLPGGNAAGNNHCDSCGYGLGKEVKLLLDQDTCPYCEQGKLSMADPVCSRCGLTIDPGFVAWG